MTAGKFDEESAKRISSAVKKIEGLAALPRYNRASSARNSDNGFFAEITDTDEAGKYAWKKLEPDADGTFEPNEEWGMGTLEENYAVEINESKTVLKLERVFLRPSISEDFFTFEYNPMGKIAKASVDIDGYVDPQAGSGTVKIYELDEGGSMTALNPTQEVTAFNTATGVVSKDVILHLKYVDGQWVVDFEDCTKPEEEE